MFYIFLLRSLYRSPPSSEETKASEYETPASPTLKRHRMAGEKKTSKSSRTVSLTLTLSPTDQSLSSSSFLHVSEVCILLQTQKKGTSGLQLAMRGMVTDSTKPRPQAN